ncbi:MAG: EAL domain-containing protein [Planctomycetia bacterium]|nr:EAL domain-containing protein [Planctomycetia bacterium]
MPTASLDDVAPPPPRTDATRDASPLGRDLDTALARGELRVVYQPIVALDDGRVVGAEALLRWTHPTRGEVLPSVFVAAAERSGAIVAIGRFVLRTACRDAAAWRRATSATPFVSVNVAHAQLLDPAFPGDVLAALRDAGLPADALTLELVETRARGSVATLARALDEVRAAGVRVAFDDFGTGFAALGDLGRLPVDVLKLPRPFVAPLPGDDTVVRAILAIGRALGLDVVAEGVEDAAQAARLRALGCGRAQGFHFARPMPADGVRAALVGRAAACA